MTNAILTNRERLSEIEASLSHVESLAEAERALDNTGAQDNPWRGSAERLTALQQEATDLRLALKGEALSAGLARFRELEAAIAKASEERERADRRTAELAQDEAVVRYRAAYRRCLQRGWGHSWSLYTPWFLSRKAKHQGLLDAAAFFVNDSACPSELRFTEDERKRICDWNEARGAAEKTLVIWDALTQQRVLLLRERPELLAAS